MKSEQITPERIREFLTLFDGDVAAAKAALESLPAAPHKSTRHFDTILISASHLAKHYKVKRQTIHAIKDISLDIYKGEFVALMAPSGSGKSTLLQLLGGLEKPSAGTVTINGVDIAKLSDAKLSRFRSKTIGFIFQFFYLQPFLNVARNIEVPGYFAGSSSQELHMRAQELAKTVGIDDRITHSPAELSGGQIQRVAIARALLNNPQVILADEPTGNLDSANSAHVIELFEKIRENFGTTIIVATHDPSIAAKADRVINLRDGVIV